MESSGKEKSQSSHPSITTRSPLVSHINSPSVPRLRPPRRKISPHLSPGPGPPCPEQGSPTPPRARSPPSNPQPQLPPLLRCHQRRNADADQPQANMPQLNARHEWHSVKPIFVRFAARLSAPKVRRTQPRAQRGTSKPWVTPPALRAANPATSAHTALTSSVLDAPPPRRLPKSTMIPLTECHSCLASISFRLQRIEHHWLARGSILIRLVNSIKGILQYGTECEEIYSCTASNLIMSSLGTTN